MLPRMTDLIKKYICELQADVFKTRKKLIKIPHYFSLSESLCCYQIQQEALLCITVIIIHFHSATF
jgi:hypothetical protein